ncbi:MAG: hypothetical protein HKO59_02905 [Phycisphaerales bacterium]|nr:DVUA0089 family protein [Phycisphaerae bacterium]NNM24931.1 hypothetical protein [Phycisphaerales bacterium]
MHEFAHPLLLSFALGVVGTPALAGPDWLETLDAGRTVLTAQDTTGAGVLSTIAGSLSPGDGEDVFLIEIQDHLGFAATTMVTAGATEFDSQLWLFDMDGFGLLGNDDDPAGGVGSFIAAPSDDGLTLELPGPGLYLIAITEKGNVPVSQNGLFPLFSFRSPTEISGPDGFAGGDPFGEWSGETGAGGQYVILIAPTPGAGMLFLVAAAMGRRRRG